MHDICVEAASAMVGKGIVRHVSFVSAEDDISFELREDQVVRVTIEFVDASEAAG